MVKKMSSQPKKNIVKEPDVYSEQPTKVDSIYSECVSKYDPYYTAAKEYLTEKSYGFCTTSDIVKLSLFFYKLHKLELDREIGQF